MAKRRDKHVKIPAITNLLSSKNLALDFGILLLGFVVIGVASAGGTWIFKWAHNNALPAHDHKIPY